MPEEPRAIQFTSPEKQLLNEELDRYLKLPERLGLNNPEKDLPKELGAFLVERGFISDIRVWKNSWGCKYNSNTKEIFTYDLPMPRAEYDYYFFRLGRDTETGEPLFPNPEEPDYGNCQDCDAELEESEFAVGVICSNCLKKVHEKREAPTW